MFHSPSFSHADATRLAGRLILPEASPPPPPLASEARDTVTLSPVPSAHRFRVVPLMLIGVLIGLLGAVVYSRTTGIAAPPAVTQILQSALRSVSPTEPEERVVFGVSSTPPASSPDLLPAGALVIYCFYDVPGVKVSGAPVVTLSKDGKRREPVPATDLKAGDRPGVGTLALKASGGFAPGVYEVELQFSDSRVLASFVAATGAEAILGQSPPRDAQVTIGLPVFAAGVGAEGKPLRLGTVFRGSDRVFFAFKYDQAEPGSAVQVKWYGGREPIESATREVLLPSVKGWANAWLQAPPPGLPAGQYRAAVNMSSDPHELASAQFTVVEPKSPPPGAPNPPPHR